MNVARAGILLLLNALTSLAFVGLLAAQTEPQTERANTAAQPVSASPDSAVRISSGDLIELNVYGIPELKQELRVSSGGRISMPLVGTIAIAGLSSEEAETEIGRHLREGGFVNHPQVSVFVKEYATQGISVLGEVEKPGIYPLLGSRRLFDAISAAGGLTEKAGSVVTITRRLRPQEPVLVELFRDPAKAPESNVEIAPGDTILISKAGVVYVVGDVKRPGGFVLDKSATITVLQALALAEGPEPTASLNSARIIRKTSDGHQEIPIQLKRVLQAKAPDVTLQSDDIVFVPASVGKGVARRSLEAIVQIATGVIIFNRY